jgi:predicted flap endonuclease-1-like 5' DNA nuclease
METEIAASLAVVEGELVRLDGLLAIAAGADDTVCYAHLRNAHDRLSHAANLLRRAILSATTQAQAFDQMSARTAGSALADRIVMIEAPVGAETFRTKVKLKPSEPLMDPPVAANAALAGRIGALPSADDLTRIRGIDPALAARLTRFGVLSFATIAGWGREDVRRVGESLGLGRQISRQNWIEQAALLRGHAAPVQPTHAMAPEVAAVPANLPATSIVATAEIADRASASSPDRLDLVRGIDEACAEVMRNAGVSRWADLIDWRRADIDRIEALLGSRGRISRQGWIEQATLLGSGRTSAHALRMIRGEFAVLVPPPPVEPLPPPQFVDWHTDERAQPPLATPPADSHLQFIMPPPAPMPEAAFAVEISDPGPAPPLAAPTSHDQRLEHAAAAPLAAAADGESASFIVRIAALEQELAALVANDAAASVEPPGPEPEVLQMQPVAARSPRDSGFNLDDEEFQELNVSEADVVIVARPIAAPPSRAESDKPDAAARGVLARLKRSAPLADIDRETYAGYRDQVEEATVEIVKPGSRGAAAAPPELEPNDPPAHPINRLIRSLTQRSD